MRLDIAWLGERFRGCITRKLTANILVLVHRIKGWSLRIAANAKWQVKRFERFIQLDFLVGLPQNISNIYAATMVGLAPKLEMTWTNGFACQVSLQNVVKVAFVNAAYAISMQAPKRRVILQKCKASNAAIGLLES